MQTNERENKMQTNERENKMQTNERQNKMQTNERENKMQTNERENKMQTNERQNKIQTCSDLGQREAIMCPLSGDSITNVAASLFDHYKIEEYISIDCSCPISLM